MNSNTTRPAIAGGNGEAKTLHPLEAAGRAFKNAYKGLSSGDKSVLRRGDPFMAAGFWRCVEAARAAGGADRVSKNEKVLAAMVPLMGLQDANGSGQNLGASLRTPRLTDRRVEIIFSESELTTLVEQIESAASIGGIKIDFGVLFRDLIDFQFRPADVRRRWARSYFNANLGSTSNTSNSSKAANAAAAVSA